MISLKRSLNVSLFFYASLILLPALITPANAQSTGLVAAYNFDEGSGSKLTDRSGVGNNGTIANAAWNTTGKNGGSLSFNGTNAMVTVNDSSSLDLTTGMTLEAWVYPTATLPSWPTILLKEQTGDLTYSIYANSDTNLPAGVIFTTQEVNVRGTKKLSLNTWTHLSVTYDGANMRFYVNGVLANTKPQTGKMATSSNPLRIGGNSVWPSEFFTGRIDDIRVYNRALSTTEIMTDMNTPVGGTVTTPPPPTTNSLVAAYNFDEGSGTVLTDRSGTSNNGTITNAAWNTTGKNGASLTFSGTNSYAKIADSNSLDLTAGMTLEAWIYPTAAFSSPSAIMLKEWTSNISYAMLAYSPTTTPGGFITVGTANYGAFGKLIVPQNTWTHLTTTYDNTNIRFYVNGVLTGTQAQTGNIATSTGALFIGGTTILASSSFKGRIDDVRIYNRALSVGEIQTDMNTPVGGSAPAPTPVNGVCGISSGQSSTTAPTTNLCSVGAASAVTTNASAYNWSCTGSNGGATAQCSMTRTTTGGATALTLSGPASGTVNVASTNFSVSANGSLASNVIVTPSSNSGGGTFTPGTVTLSSSVSTAMFTYTPASAGTKTISITNNGGLTNPRSVSFIANSPAVSGTCGSSNGQSFSSAPTANLCSSGTASAVTTNTSNYTWNCAGTNGGATAQCSAAKTVTPAPTVTFSAAPVSITTGQSSILTWSSTNSSSCTASGGWSGTKAISGTQSVTPTANTTYLLTCTGAGGTSSAQSVTVSVSSIPNPPPEPPVTSDIPQFLTHDGDLVGDVFNSSAPSKYYWNNVLQFTWKRGVYGDWLDANQKPFGESTTGAVPYASFAASKPGVYTATVTNLVSRWMTTGQNRGFYMRMKNNPWPVRFAGRTDATAANQPTLTIVTSTGTYSIIARANASWDMSTYGILSSSKTWTLSGNSVAILHFDLTSVTGTVQSASLKITDIAHDGGTSGTSGVVEIYEADPPMFMVPHGSNNKTPETGFAYKLASFKDIASQPGVIFSDDFASPGPFDSGWSQQPERALNTETNTTYARGMFVGGANDSASNKILAMRGANGDGGQGMTSQQDDLYSQYHLYLENDFGSNIDGIKIPAMGTQFGYWRTYNGGYWQMVTGNGGAPGTGLKIWNAAQSRWEYEGHSVRIVTTSKPADNSAYASLYGLKLYPYNLDQVGAFPDMVNFPYVAVQKERWYAIDLYMKLNSMSGARDANGNYAVANPDGEYRVWVNGYPALTKTNFRWRKHPEFGVEGFWLDFYHGGVPPAPYTMHYRVDRVTIAKNYIGPQKSEITGGSTTTNPKPTPTADSGVCGTSNGGSFNSAPTANLCTSGTATAVSSNTTSFTWDCTGSNGGTTTNCSAAKIIPATALTLTGPTSGAVNASSGTFTVGANGTISGNVSVAFSSNGGGGTFTPANVNLSSSSPTATFTYAPNSTGAKSISMTNNGGLTNPSPMSYTVNNLNLPSWVPAPGEVAVLTQANGKITNQFESQVAPYYDPFYYVKTVNDYSTGFKNPYWGTYGATVFWGGGHAGTNDNTVTVAEYGQSAITFKRVSDPTPWTGSTATDANNRGSNSAGNFNSILNYTYMEGPDGQPGSPHSYSCGDIIGPENGGAQYGTLVQIASSAVNLNNDAGASAAHKIDFDTLTLQKSDGTNRKWTRITNNVGPSGFLGASPHYTAFVPAQNRIYYFASSGSTARWFDRNTNTYVMGTGTGFDLGPSDGFDSGIVFHVPSRNILVAMYPQGNTLKVQWMDVSVNQPTIGGTATLSQSLAISDPWSAATWVPDSNRIVLAGVTGDDTAAYEIEIPSTLTNTWTVTRAPFASGQTFTPYDKQAGIGLTYKKFQYDPKVHAIVYMPRAERDGVNETIYVYRPRGT